MRLLVLFIFVMLISASAFAQIDPANFSIFSIAQISPEYVNEREYIDSTNTFILIQKPRFYSMITKDSLHLDKLNSEQLLKASVWKKMKGILNPPQKELDKLGEREVADCYIPRHAIIFYNESDSIIGLIEVCFECQEYRSFGICNNWGINITPNGFIILERIFARNNLIQ